MLSRFSVKKPYTVIVGIVLVIILGVVSLSKMSTDLLPSINLPYAIVVTTYPGASPEQVEDVVTQPIEGAMASTSNIKNISSTSSNNTSMVALEFEQTTNMDSVTVEMRESLDQISSYWPDTVGNPIIMKLNPDMMPIMIAAIEVEGMDSLEISDYTDTDLIPELESVEGVASVSGTGLIEESIRVTLSQEKIDAVNRKITASLEEKFSDAQNEMDSAEDEISSGKEELDNGKTEMAGQLSDAQNQLNDKKIELFQTESDMHAKLDELRKTRTSTEQGITALKELQGQVSALIKGKASLNQGILKLQGQQEKLKQQSEQLQSALKQLRDQKEQLQQLLPVAPEEQQITLQAQLIELEKQIKTLDAQAGKLQEPQELIESQLEELQEQLEQAEDGLSQIKAFVKGGKGIINGGLAFGYAPQARFNGGNAPVNLHQPRFCLRQGLGNLLLQFFIGSVFLHLAAFPGGHLGLNLRKPICHP